MRPCYRLVCLASAALDSARQACGRLSTPAPRVLIGGTVGAPGAARFRVRAGTDDIYTLLPGRELDVHDAILDTLTAGDTFVDVGSNVGYYTVAAWQKVGPQGSVMAIEASPTTAAALRTNLTLNSATSVAVLEAAAVAVATVAVNFAERPKSPGLAAVDPSGGISVRGVTIDEACAALGTVTVMKIDVEGGEIDALAGATETLKRTQRVVVECEDLDLVEDVLTDAGFAVERLRFTRHLLADRR